MKKKKRKDSLDKATLRKNLCEKRKSIDPTTRQQYAEQAAELLIATSLFQKSQHIACYLATSAEFDCCPILKKSWEANKQCYLPVLRNKQLEFVLYQQKDSLHLNQHRILEPDRTETFPADQLDLVIVPLVGFDLKGHRLGMGGGYYDRTFFFLKRIKKPILLGLGYSCQKIANFPPDSWDIPLSGIITEKEFFLTR